jgi:hypothetical protein
MPWRFRRSVKVLPGVKINFGKRGMSTTIGGRGFKKTYGHGQTRTTVGLPGSGLSYTSVRNRRRKSQGPAKPAPKWSELGRPTQVITIILTLVIIGVCSFCCISLYTSVFASSPIGDNPTPGNQAAASSPNATTAPTKAPTPTPNPKPKPTATPTPKPSCRYMPVNNNPWCYTFTNTGKLIYDPNAAFCSYFNCISSFWNGSGYVVECNDGDYSKSGGKTGVCSGSHGGLKRNLYAG